MHIIYYQSTGLTQLVRQLMAYSDLQDEEARLMASESINRTDSFPPSLQDRADWPKLPENEMRIANFRIDQIRKAVERSYPLLEDEVLLEDGFLITYLVEDYFNYPAGTVVVRRKSSFGEIYFMDTTFSFDGQAIQGTASPKILDIQPVVVDPEMYVFNWAKLATSIGKSLVSGFFDQMGSAIFDKLFPPGVPSYFQEVYVQFEKIINKSLSEFELKRLSAKVLAIQSGMHTYNTIKVDPNQFKESQRILSTLWNESREVTVSLMVFNDIGLGVFSVAGGLHLAILQERAFTDRGHADPNKSQWAVDLRFKADEFHVWANQHYAEAIQKRGAAISEVTFEKKFVIIPGVGPVDESFYFWKDDYTGEYFKYYSKEGCCDRDPKGTAKRERQERWNQTVVVMTTNLQPLRLAIIDWRELKSKPLPLPKKQI